MRANNGLLKKITQFGLLLMMGVSMSAEAGLFGNSKGWKEEVQLHDGQKLIVERSQSYGGSHEIVQTPPIKEQKITFTVPNTSKIITFKSEYSEDIGRTNLNLLALHILNAMPYIVASPNLCLSYNKWGRPNPPYVFFKYDGKAWQRIPLSEFPAEFKEVNLLIDTYGHDDVDQEIKSGFVSYVSVKKLNGTLTQPEFQTILREPLPAARIKEMCEVMYPDGKGGWLGAGWFDQPTQEACLQFCTKKGIAAEFCKCNISKKGK